MKSGIIPLLEKGFGVRELTEESEHPGYFLACLVFMLEALRAHSLSVIHLSLSLSLSLSLCSLLVYMCVSQCNKEQLGISVYFA